MGIEHEVKEQRELIASLMLENAALRNTSAKQETEIERLRMELTKVGNGSYNPALVLAEQEAEIERLRNCTAADGWTINKQAAEIERKRGLLREHLLGPTEVMTWRQAHEWHEDYLKRVREELGDE